MCVAWLNSVVVEKYSWCTVYIITTRSVYQPCNSNNDNNNNNNNSNNNNNTEATATTLKATSKTINNWYSSHFVDHNTWQLGLEIRPVCSKIVPSLVELSATHTEARHRCHRFSFPATVTCPFRYRAPLPTCFTNVWETTNVSNNLERRGRINSKLWNPTSCYYKRRIACCESFIHVIINVE